MSFEKTWQTKIEENLSKTTGGREIYHDNPPPQEEKLTETVSWTANLVNEMIANFSPDQIHDILTACACRYPSDSLKFLKQYYQETGDLRGTHDKLQTFFLTMIRKYKDLEDHHMDYLQKMNMGMAGTLEGRTITAVKVPKDFKDFYDETDKDKKAKLYCHCPRIRESLSANPSVINKQYCLCSAGFYRFIWEDILDKPVGVTIEKSLLAGDPICQIRIDLPEEMN